MKQLFKILMLAALALPFSGCDVEYDPIVILPDVVLEDSGMTTVRPFPSIRTMHIPSRSPAPRG